MHFVPGGPVERQIMRYQMAAMTEGGAGAAASGRGSDALPEEAIEEIRRYYGFDKPVHVRYAQWLWNVAAPRPRHVLRLPGSGLGRHQVALSRLDLPRPHRVSPELSGLRAARRPEGHPATARASTSSAASSCFSATRCRAGRSARRCSCCSAAAASGACSRSAASGPTTGST